MVVEEIYFPALLQPQIDLYPYASKLSFHEVFMKSFHVLCALISA